MNTGQQKKLASKQISRNEFTVQAVAEAARVAIQTIDMASTPRQDNTRLITSGSIIKHPTFNWYAKDKMKNCETSN